MRRAIFCASAAPDVNTLRKPTLLKLLKSASELHSLLGCNPERAREDGLNLSKPKHLITPFGDGGSRVVKRCS